MKQQSNIYISEVSSGISLIEYFGFSTANFCLKIYNRKAKMHYKWDLDEIPPDTL
jgi:hypothetical protein